MRSKFPGSFRALSVLAIALIGVLLVAGISPGATKFLTKKRALKLFYTKSQADERFLQGSEAEAAFLNQAEGDARYVEKGGVQTGHFSCQANAWGEHDTSEEFTYSVSTGRATTTGALSFSCNAALPHGATVTAVRWTVQDTSSTENVACLLQRYDLATGVPTTLANTSSGVPATPGTVRLSDTSIGVPVIDNRDFAYTLTCVIAGFGVDVGFHGASVEYTVTGSQGAAS